LGCQFAASLFVLYAGAVIAGVGAGAVYGTCVGNALKWFSDRRGFGQRARQRLGLNSSSRCFAFTPGKGLAPLGIDSLAHFRPRALMAVFQRQSGLWGKLPSTISRPEQTRHIAEGS
jgi:hypothetical protein